MAHTSTDQVRTVLRSGLLLWRTLWRPIHGRPRTTCAGQFVIRIPTRRPQAVSPRTAIWEPLKRKAVKLTVVGTASCGSNKKFILRLSPYHPLSPTPSGVEKVDPLGPDTLGPRRGRYQHWPYTTLCTLAVDHAHPVLVCI
jgi:hypothetical protein